MAGFVRNSGHASRLQRTIAALLQVAEDSQDYDTPARDRETRITLLEAHRLRRELMEMRRAEREISVEPHARRREKTVRTLPDTNPPPLEPTSDRPEAGETIAEPTAEAPEAYPDLPETYPAPTHPERRNALRVEDWGRVSPL